MLMIMDMKEILRVKLFDLKSRLITIINIKLN